MIIHYKMSIECSYCSKLFRTTYVLKRHQESAKFCLKIQGKKPITCDGCKKEFNKFVLLQHQLNCVQYNILEEEKKREGLLTIIQDQKEQIHELRSIIERIATTSIINDKKKIQELTRKYVQKQPREQFPHSNVMYIVTTQALQAERRYILGKATNLTKRMSTYNKTDEHEVIFYQPCKSKQTLSVVETLVFQKLDAHREQANRERFILPPNKTIDFFIDEIKACCKFTES